MRVTTGRAGDGRLSRVAKQHTIRTKHESSFLEELHGVKVSWDVIGTVIKLERFAAVLAMGNQ